MLWNTTANHKSICIQTGYSTHPVCRRVLCIQVLMLCVLLQLSTSRVSSSGQIQTTLSFYAAEDTLEGADCLQIKAKPALKCAVTMNSKSHNIQERRNSYEIIIIAEEGRNFNQSFEQLMQHKVFHKAFWSYWEMLILLNYNFLYNQMDLCFMILLWCPSGFGLRPSLVFYIHW